MDNKQVIGLCWYQPEQWDRLIEISDDRDELDDSFEAWRRNARNSIQQFQARGIRVQKVNIDLEAFLLWCNEKSLPVNGASRSRYVVTVLQEAGS